MIEQCACGSGQLFSSCCLQLISGERQATSPEQLMRSRFCAFKIANGSYLYETHHPDFRGNLTAEELTLSAKQSNWCKLEVVKSQLDSNSHGTVYFRAFFIKAGYLYCHTELSFFSKYEDQWMYQRGEFPGDSFTPKKLGRNEICPCDSGKKFKSCCS